MFQILLFSLHHSFRQLLFYIANIRVLRTLCFHGALVYVRPLCCVSVEPDVCEGALPDQIR